MKYLNKFNLALIAGTLISFNVSAGYAPYHSKAASKKAVEFAPGVLSTKTQFEINTVFNKAGDRVIISRCSDDFSKCTMMESEFKDNQWQQPKVLPFSGEYLDADPYYNEDFSQLYFISKRPIIEGGEETKSINLWRVAFKNGQWQQPEYLSDLSSDSEDLYPSITDNGDLYFPSFRNNQRHLYVAKKTAHGFSEPQPLPEHIYGENGQTGDAVVLRDGNTIIFSMKGRKDSKGKGDLYISKKINGDWTVARSLGDKVNSPDHEFTPIVSPNGEYLFFTRIENGRGNLYQIKLSALGVKYFW